MATTVASTNPICASSYLRVPISHRIKRPSVDEYRGHYRPNPLPSSSLERSATSFRPLRPTPTSDRRDRFARRRETYSTRAFRVTSATLVFSRLAISRSFLRTSSSKNTVVLFMAYLRVLAYAGIHMTLKKDARPGGVSSNSVGAAGTTAGAYHRAGARLLSDR